MALIAAAPGRKFVGTQDQELLGQRQGLQLALHGVDPGGIAQPDQEIAFGLGSFFRRRQ
jgi:hypothetical protein